MRMRWLKIGKWILVVTLLLAVASGILTVIQGRRYAAAVEQIRTEGDPVSVLQVGGPAVPDAENAALLYRTAFESMEGNTARRHIDILAHVPVKEGVDRLWDPHSKVAPQSDRLRKLFHSPEFWSKARASASALTVMRPALEAAVAKPSCRFAVRWEDGFDARLPHYPALRDTARVLSAQAILQAREGHQEKALKSLELAFEVADSSCQDEIMIAVLVRSAMVAYANNALLGVLKYGAPSAESASEWNSILQTTDYGAQYAESLRSERALSIWAFNYVMQGGFGDLLKAMGMTKGTPNRAASRAMALFGRPVLYSDGIRSLEHFRKVIAVAEQPYRTGEMLRLDDELRKYGFWAVLTRTFMPDFSRCRARVDETRARTAMTQIVLAAQQYKKRLGEYPSSIHELAAWAEWELPADPFSGKNLGYKRSGDGFRVYSVGMDLDDDGGVPAKPGKWQSSGGLPYQKTMNGDLVLHWR